MNSQIVSHYKIVEKLGGGGMGVVYEAEDSRFRSCINCFAELVSRRTLPEKTHYKGGRIWEKTFESTPTSSFSGALA
jgi:serine/threonine protein kinase